MTQKQSVAVSYKGLYILYGLWLCNSYKECGYAKSIAVTNELTFVSYAYNGH